MKWTFLVENEYYKAFLMNEFQIRTFSYIAYFYVMLHLKDAERVPDFLHIYNQPLSIFLGTFQTTL